MRQFVYTHLALPAMHNKLSGIFSFENVCTQKSHLEDKLENIN